MSREKLKKQASGVALAALVVVAGVAAMSENPAEDSIPPREVEPVAVSVERVVVRPLEAPIRLTGEIRAVRSTRIRAEAGARVIEMPWRLGDRVEAGAMLARLDGSKNELTVRQAAARVAQGEITLEQSRRKRVRSQRLFDGEKISVEKYDDAVFAHRRAEAELELRRAELATLERIAEDFVIRAPYDGFISGILVEEGDFVVAGSDTFELVQADGAKASFQVPAEHVGSFERGTVHRVEIPALERSFDAKIAAIAKQADGRSRTFEMELDLGPEVDASPGMIAKFSVRLATDKRGYFVPSSAVVEKFGGSYIFVYEHGTAREIPVTIDQRDGERVAVSGALDEGTWVIAKGQHRLDTGARVIAGTGERVSYSSLTYR